MRGLLIAGMVMAVAPGVHAVEWTQVFADEKRVVHVDADSIKVSGDVAKVWEMWDYRYPQDGVMSVKTMNEYDCGNDKFRIVTSYSYSQIGGRGERLGEPESSRWIHPIPETVGSHMYGTICKTVKYR